MTVKPMREPPPYLPASYELADASAIQALERGEATPEQQKRALNWIIQSAAAVGEFEYRTEERDHVFASGRRFVGLQVQKMIAINTGAFR